VLDFSFWGCHLIHNRARVAISVEIFVAELPPLEVKVTLPDTQMLNFPGPKTSPVRHLKRFVALVLGKSRDEFENDNGPVDPSVVLGAIDSPEIGIHLNRSEFRFDWAPVLPFVSLPTGAAIGQARKALANQLGQPQDAVKVLVNGIPQDRLRIEKQNKKPPRRLPNPEPRTSAPGTAVNARYFELSSAPAL
jgi:hypothetical protein